MMVGGFIHLYHIWGLFGLITAILFGRQGYVLWREQGGAWRDAPAEWLYYAYWFTREAVADVGRFAKWAVRSFLGLPFSWGENPWQSKQYSRQQIILVGITFGGTSRFLTALYWAEKNRAWMEHVDSGVIYMASAPIILAILGDINHHLTAWPNKRHRVRLVAVVAALWILIGVMGIPV